LKKAFLLTAALLCMAGFAFAAPMTAPPDVPTEAPTIEAPAAPEAIEPNKNVITMDIVPFFKSFAVWDSDTDTYPFGMAFNYERYLNGGFSALGRFGFYAGKVQKNNFFYWEMEAHGRYYFGGNAYNKLFIDAGLGYNDMICKKMSDYEFQGFKFSLAIGWKFVFVKHLECEPLISYVIAKSDTDSKDHPVFTPVGWQIGFNMGTAF
jgi:hypothetical protein